MCVEEVGRKCTEWGVKGQVAGTGRTKETRKNKKACRKEEVL